MATSQTIIVGPSIFPKTSNHTPPPTRTDPDPDIGGCVRAGTLSRRSVEEPRFAGSNSRSRTGIWGSGTTFGAEMIDVDETYSD